MKENTKSPRTDTITFDRTHFFSVLVVLAFAVGILVGYMAWGRNGTAAVQNTAPQAQAPVAEVPAPGMGPDVYLQIADDLGLETTAFEACLSNHTYQEDIQSDSDYAISIGVNSTPTFFVNGLAIIGAQPLDVFTQVIDMELAGETPQNDQYVRYEIPTEGFPTNGPEDAPITIVEFSDFQCPFCGRFYNETYQPLLDAYPGQIRFVYRHLPLTSIHPEAFPAAEASMCANEQGSFWQYHDALFSLFST
jgi:protein-disulfide isomerase